MSKVGAIILAAGNSSRLGRPKQLVPYRGQTLLTHTTTETGNAGVDPAVVVTGAFHTAVSESLRGHPPDILFNPAWETGMASGIVAGLSHLLSRQPAMSAVIISVCDQPFISSKLLLQLITTHQASGKGIVACAYAGSMGTPVLFGQPYFQQLLKLTGSKGANRLLRQHPADLATVDFPDGHIDIDTADDLSKLE
jgi:molybdenum cofactor cytidylyltransferase